MSESANTTYRLWTRAAIHSSTGTSDGWEDWGAVLDTWEGLVFAATLEALEGKEVAYTRTSGDETPTPFDPQQLDTQVVEGLFQECFSPNDTAEKGAGHV